jgi:hypothetical protein
MNRRQFAVRSLAAVAGVALSQRRSCAATQSSAALVPGAIPNSMIKEARFPEGFLWGVATALIRTKVHGTRMARVSRSGIDLPIHRERYGEV